MKNEPRTPARGSLVPALGALLLSTLAAGCVSSRGQAQNTYTGGEGQEMEVQVANRTLRRDLEILRPRCRRLEDGRLHVQFELHSRKNSNLAFEWQVEWFDDEGFRLDTPDRWTPASIVGHGYETISVTSPTPEASQWRLAVQKPNTVR